MSAEAEEFRRCRRDFFRFCRRHIKIEDAETQESVPFRLWPGQRETGKRLLNGEWLLILKARQLGFTWLLAALVLWLITFHKRRRVIVFFQDRDYAAEFLDRIRAIHDELPKFMRLTRTKDNRRVLEFNKNNHGGVIVALAPTKRAARSYTANLVICDEAAYIELLPKILKAAKPALEVKGGQCVVLSTSNGPAGHFFELWQQAREGKGRFKPLFFPWSARPGRDADWYARESKDNAGDPLYMKQEYPASPEEAFESAAGRVYPLFVAHGADGQKFQRAVAIRPEWKHFRAIDFGGVDPFVCLWACEIPGEAAGLTISPACPHTIREMLAYAYADNGRPKDENNHAPDALRYLVITPGQGGLRGHVHVYRELYVPDSARAGLSLPDLAHRILDWTGDQRIETTVADRSRPDSMTLLCQLGIPTIPARVLSGVRGGEIEQGILRVNALITATAKGQAAALPEMKSPRLPKDWRPGQMAPWRRAIFA